MWNVQGLGDVGEPLYLNVQVYPTDFEDPSIQQAGIYVNDVLIDICRPAEDCGLEFFTCVANMDVSDSILLSRGGELQIEVKSVGVFSTECDYEGYPLYVQMSVSDELSVLSEGNSTRRVLFGCDYCLFIYYHTDDCIVL